MTELFSSFSTAVDFDLLLPLPPLFFFELDRDLELLSELADDAAFDNGFCFAGDFATGCADSAAAAFASGSASLSGGSACGSGCASGTSSRGGGCASGCSGGSPAGAEYSGVHLLNLIGEAGVGGMKGFFFFLGAPFCTGTVLARGSGSCSTRCSALSS